MVKALDRRPELAGRQTPDTNQHQGDSEREAKMGTGAVRAPRPRSGCGKDHGELKKNAAQPERKMVANRGNYTNLVPLSGSAPC